MIILIAVSIIPLNFKTEIPFLNTIEKCIAIVFVIDYLLRWITADYKYNSKGVFPFLKYPFSFMAIIDLLSILPSFIVINESLKLLRVLRMIRAFRVFRVFKALRYSKSFAIITSVIKKSKHSLIAVALMALGFIWVSALIIFNVEPESFDTMFDAIYWATISLTTVGYGDIYATSVVGRIITMLASLMGIAVVALPAGIITAGFMTEIQKYDDNQEKEEQ